MDRGKDSRQQAADALEPLPVDVEPKAPLLHVVDKARGGIIPIDLQGCERMSVVAGVSSDSIASGAELQ